MNLESKEVLVGTALNVLAYIKFTYDCTHEIISIKIQYDRVAAHDNFRF
jgi:hypothetical protein